MKQTLQVISDIFSIALAAAVLGGAYLYTNPQHAHRLLAEGRAWLTLATTLPAIGIADVVLLAAMTSGLIATVFLLTRGRQFLRGPVTITLVR